MHVWPDTPVTTADGIRVGASAAVVIHPSSWKTLAVIIRRPGLWRRSICVPADVIDRSTPQGVWLAIKKAQFDQLDRSTAPPHQRPPRDWLTPLGWPGNRVYWPAGYQGPVYPQLRASELKHWGTVRAPALADQEPPPGAPVVVSQDGYQLGDHARMHRDGADAGYLVFQSNGALWPEGQVQIPAQWVGVRDAWEAQLAFDRDTIRQLTGQAPQPTRDVVGGRIVEELAREQRGESSYDVDPYDVLARPSISGFKTAYERDDASVINPQPRPDDRRR